VPPEIDQSVEFFGGECSAPAIGITRSPLAVGGGHNRDRESELVHLRLLLRARCRRPLGRGQCGADQSACCGRLLSVPAGVQPPYELANLLNTSNPRDQARNG
jgi:hypothetical protein